MKKNFLLLLLSLTSYSTVWAYQTEELKQTLQQLSDKVLEADSTIPGILIHVEAPDMYFSYSVASGVSDIKTGASLNPEGSVRIASNTKTYVAASILRLWEEGKLNLNDPISKYISQEHSDILEDDGYEMDTITIHHLLTHTSGMYDHAASNTYFQKVFGEPSYEWTRTEQIQGCADWGDPLFKPGEEFSYSDTGYILLGEVIEKLTGESLGEAVRTLIGFEKLGLESTWWEKLEQKPETASDRIHQYFQGNDTYGYDPSLDLNGGGGLVANSKDLALFYQELFSGNVFDESATLDTMLTKISFPESYTPTSDYRMGIFYFNFDEVEVYSHSGFWGTEVTYIPELNATVSVITTQFGKIGVMRQLLRDVIELLQETE
ncbi:MAG: beta-lactamase family protein [Balneolaceae bacterium]|nr:beta-lactamase family protein [Balneolaceae bacterium]MBO6547962.1 beta-lactamase family protein [Balneolaceae bacterium]MBO6648475.1 beta-lactamase family protein [Balneolaceae bacterium]